MDTPKITYPWTAYVLLGIGILKALWGDDTGQWIGLSLTVVGILILNIEKISTITLSKSSIAIQLRKQIEEASKKVAMVGEVTKGIIALNLAQQKTAEKQTRSLSGNGRQEMLEGYKKLLVDLQVSDDEIRRIMEKADAPDSQRTAESSTEQTTVKSPRKK